MPTLNECSHSSGIRGVKVRQLAAISTLLSTMMLFYSAALEMLMAQEHLATNQQQSTTQPSRVDIQSLPSNRSTNQLPVKVVLLDKEGKPAKATENTAVKIQSSVEGKQRSEQILKVPLGQESATTFIPPDKRGPVKVEVTDVDDKLIRSTSYAPPSREQPHRISAADISLMLTVSGENDGGAVRADGQNSARVQVLAIGGEPPSSDIRVWLKVSEGKIPDNPLIIKHGEMFGELHWFSNEVGWATIEVVRTNPRDIEFEGPKKLSARFIQPISGLAIVGAPAKISLVDAPSLTVQFRDLSDRPIATDIPRRIRLVSNNPVLKPDPAEIEIPANRSDSATTLFPAFIGKSTIEASTAGYPARICTIEVVARTVILLCIGGATLGGVLGFVTSKKSFWGHIIGGLVLGLVASWAYVMIGLPHVNQSILHNDIAVFFVSILAAFAGVKILEPIVKALGLQF